MTNVVSPASEVLVVLFCCWYNGKVAVFSVDFFVLAEWLSLVWLAEYHRVRVGGWTSPGAWQAWKEGIRDANIARMVPALAGSQKRKVLAQQQESFTGVLAGKCHLRVV